MTPTIPEKLRIQFRKSISKGYTPNAELAPRASEAVIQILEAGEDMVVRVISKQGQTYWFTDRRLLREDAEGLQELLRYKSVCCAHWMFKDVCAQMMRSQNPAGFKQRYFDRLEIELPERLVVLEGLEQAYWPVLRFFWWIAPSCAPQTPRPDRPAVEDSTN